ncbi:hypothetical protein BIV25_10760 [Streptomyces sp. MUSC 14]|nr:hypothetical protein BIV25_10760 [Streptomyces sp. MUSC 14]
MTGRHRMPEADGRTAGATLLGAVGVGLGLVASIVTTDVRAAPHASFGYSRPDAAALADHTSGHICRCGSRIAP